jgi:S-DNA-T family DNA segregation ATPase FtsK/SpoIIIE
MAACAECGYDAESLTRGEIVLAVASMAGQHRELLSTVRASLLTGHPRPESWSALEYGCHVRDMLRIQRERILLAQREETPAFVPLRRDERAVRENYNGQDPVVVASQIADAAAGLTGTLAGLDDTGWRRTGIYSYPAPEVRTVEWIGRRTAHELAHHLFDNRRLLASEPG